MRIGKYSFGLGDRFAQQGKAQLSAIKKAKEGGIEITPVWNKSYREHTTIHSNPADVRIEADTSVRDLKWDAPYFVDADHINLKTVDHFIEYADFFTLDVADYIGQKADEQTIESLIADNKKFIGSLSIPGIEKPFSISETRLKEIAEKFALATQEAGKIYR
ncbi:MAG: tagaturonate epimerase family protein, partial [Bacteroidota bacterium]